MYEDPGRAQAKQFLNELQQYAQTLMKRRQQHGAGDPGQRSIDTELAAVSRQIELLLRRVPNLNMPATG